MMNRNIFIFLFLSLVLSGCIYTPTVEYSCEYSSSNFIEGYKCIKDGYSNTYAPNSPAQTETEKDMDCGEELADLVAKKELTDKRAWYLFKRVRGGSANSIPDFKCVDFDYLAAVEKSADKRMQEKGKIVNR